MLKQTHARNFATLSKMKEFSGDLGLEVEKEDFERSRRDQVCSLNLGGNQEFGESCCCWVRQPCLKETVGSNGGLLEPRI